MSAGPKPGPGWYYAANAWHEITPEEKAEARELIDAGYTQTSAKYRDVAIFDRSSTPWKVVDSMGGLSLGVFASFKEQTKHDAEVQAHHDRESRRPRAKRIAEILRKLPDDRAEELVLDLLTCRSWSEWTYAREVELIP